eukprot:jgi/Picre1/35944/NNA_003401.t1
MFGSYSPVLSADGTACVSHISVASVIAMIPMEGFLEQGGGIKFVVKRTDGGGEVWIKSHRGDDFYLDMDTAIRYLNPPQLQQSIKGDGTKTKSALSTSLDISNTDVPGDDALVGGMEEEEAEEEEEEEEKKFVRMVMGQGPRRRYNFRVDGRQNSDIKGARKEELSELLRHLGDECTRLEDGVQSLHAAEMTSRQLQLEKERLCELRDSAMKESNRMESELQRCVGETRRMLVQDAGRDSEVILKDLGQLCKSQVLGDGKRGLFKSFLRESEPSYAHIFVSEATDKVQGIDAHVVSHVYLEGDAAAVRDALQDTDEERDETAAVASSNRIKASPFEAVVVSICFGEDFPGKISNSKLLLHHGLVSRRHGKWQQLPKGSEIPIQRRGESTEASVDFEAYVLQHTSGKPVFVEPILRGVCLRFPIEELRSKRLRGMEFVLFSRETWLQKEGGENFYVEFPLIP